MYLSAYTSSMDTLTHALSGALLARATEPRATRPGQLPGATRMWVGFWAAAFPDGDFVLRLIDPLLYLTTHRGITHSVVLLPLWALGLGAAFYYLTRRRYSWRALVGVCAMAIGAHIVGDVITAFGTIERAVDLLRLGAVDYLCKPFDIEDLLGKITRYHRPIPVLGPVDELSRGTSSSIVRLRSLLPKYAKSADTVLITGESGVGKEFIARLLHHFDEKRGSKPFLAINCAAIPDARHHEGRG